MEGGTEIRLFDARRNPQTWTDLMRPAECAVLFKSRTGSTSLSPDGQPYARQSEVTCIVFPGFEAAQRFCEQKVQSLPHLRCEIYDAQGLANPPLAVILHPDVQRREDAGSIWSRRRKLIAGSLVLMSIPLFWIGTGSSSSSDLAIFFGINCLVLALRFVYWDFGLRHRERERRKRLEAHRKLEKGDA